MLALKKEEPPMDDTVVRLDSRVARLESDVAHLRSDVSVLQLDVRDLRKTVDAKFEALSEKMDRQFNKLAAEISDAKVWALVVIGGGLLGVLAHALHWL